MGFRDFMAKKKAEYDAMGERKGTQRLQELRTERVRQEEKATLRAKLEREEKRISKAKATGRSQTFMGKLETGMKKMDSGMGNMNKAFGSMDSAFGSVFDPFGSAPKKHKKKNKKRSNVKESDKYGKR